MTFTVCEVPLIIYYSIAPGRPLLRTSFPISLQNLQVFVQSYPKGLARRRPRAWEERVLIKGEKDKGGQVMSLDESHFRKL